MTMESVEPDISWLDFNLSCDVATCSCRPLWVGQMTCRCRTVRLACTRHKRRWLRHWGGKNLTCDICDGRTAIAWRML